MKGCYPHKVAILLEELDVEYVVAHKVRSYIGSKSHNHDFFIGDRGWLRWRERHGFLEV